MAGSNQKNFEVTIPSNLAKIEYVEAQAEKAAEQMEFNEDEKDSLAIAVTEAVNNAIIHGNKRDQKKKVTIKFIFEGKQLTVRIKDQGKGFKPESVSDPLAPENLLKESGRGIFILSSLMDDVQYEFHEDGTEIILIKIKK